MHFEYSSTYMTIPNSLTIPSPILLPATISLLSKSVNLFLFCKSICTVTFKSPHMRMSDDISPFGLFLQVSPPRSSSSSLP